MSALSQDEASAALLHKVQQARHSPVVVEVSTFNRYDRERGRWCDHLRVVVVLAAPGREDSRYSELFLDTLPAEGPEEREGSLAVVRGVAARLGVRVHLDGTPAAARWLDLQGPPPTRAWHFRWCTIEWREDGSEVHESGERRVDAERGNLAADAVERAFRERLTPPFRLTLESDELGPLAERRHSRAYPRTLPPVSALRAWAVQGRSPAALLRGLDPATALDRMLGFEEAFCVDLRALAPVHAWLAGAMTDEELDAALAPALARTRGLWSLPVRLLEAHAQGRSLGPVLHEFHDRHGLGVMLLIKAMREAFEMSLMTAKTLVDIICSGERQDELDAAVTAVVAAIRAGDRDERAAMHAALVAFHARRG